MNAKYLTSGFAFAGNPIILESDETPEDGMRGASFLVKYEGKQVYSGRFYPPLNIDFSEIAASVAEWLPERGVGGVGPLNQLADFSAQGSKTRMMEVTVDYGHTDENFSAILLPGGISKQNFRYYARSGKDVFDSRLFPKESNFFFTTRTNDWRIEVKETELYPLYFVVGNKGVKISLEGSLSNQPLEYDLRSGVFALDIDNMRRINLEETGSLENVFNVFIDKVFACQIVITFCKPEKDRYRLKFRNSFGVFEIIDISGQLIGSAEKETEEETGYSQIDDVTRSFLNLRERVENDLSYSITINKGNNSSQFILDMISSEEIYLLDAFDMPVRVNVTAESLQWQHIREIPERITLKLAVVESETFCNEPIDSTTGSKKPRIHTKEFNKPFN